MPRIIRTADLVFRFCPPPLLTTLLNFTPQTLRFLLLNPYEHRLRYLLACRCFCWGGPSPHRRNNMCPSSNFVRTALCCDFVCCQLLRFRAPGGGRRWCVCAGVRRTRSCVGLLACLRCCLAQPRQHSATTYIAEQARCYSGCSIVCAAAGGVDPWCHAGQSSCC